MADPNLTYQGKPCKHGHNGIRYTRSGNCVECTKFWNAGGRANIWRRPPEKHGYTKLPIYSVWTSMIGRCCNPNDKDYPNYGGRGIKVCDSWRNSFLIFYKDVITEIGERPGPGWVLDRINNDGHYEPGNIRWADAAMSARNTRHTKLTVPKARAARDLYGTGRWTQRQIGNLFDVAEATIQDIIVRRRWKE